MSFTSGCDESLPVVDETAGTHSVGYINSGRLDIVLPNTDSSSSSGHSWITYFSAEHGQRHSEFIRFSRVPVLSLTETAHQQLDLRFKINFGFKLALNTQNPSRMGPFELHRNVLVM